MRRIFLFNKNPEYKVWDEMWSSRTIEQEVKACEIETAPRILFHKFIPKNAKILDAGCGYGKWVVYLSRYGYDIVGIDNNMLAIDNLRKYDEMIKIEVGDILNLPFPKDYFDAYISMGVVEHFEKGPIPALKEAYRVLKPNGLIFVSTPTINLIRKLIIQPIQNFLNQLPYFLKKLPIFNVFFKKKLERNKKEKKSKYKKQRYYHFLEYRFSKEELEYFIRKANFKILHTLPHDYSGSNNHSIGLTLDLPFLKNPFGEPYELNFMGKLISRILNRISPWITCASVICVGKSLKKN